MRNVSIRPFDAEVCLYVLNSQGQLYVVGGSNGHSDELSCGEAYDPHADEWTQMSELRTNRCNAGQSAPSARKCCRYPSSINGMTFFFSVEGVCSLNNKLYVVGGSDPCGQKGLKNCDAFDPVTKTWSKCASLNISMCLQFIIYETFIQMSLL